MDRQRINLQTITIESVIDAAPLSRFLVGIVMLCAVVALLDGFDTLAISYLAPAIADDLHLAKQAFGPIFAAHYAGAALGAAGFGMLADRYGRRPVILCSTAIFGIFALCTPFAHDVPTLLAARGLTGIGLGGALSNVIALVAEYAPGRLRATLVSVMYAAFPVGGVIGGPLSAYIVARYGWQPVFVIGGILPLLLLLVLYVRLPESVRYLLAKGRPDAEVAALLRRLAPAAAWNGKLALAETGAADRLPLREIFSHAHRRATSLLWTASFLTQLVIVFVITWMPTLLKAAGLPLGRAIITSVVFSVGGIVGSLLLARLIDRSKSYRPLVAAFLLAALAIAAIGYTTASAALLFAVVGCAGICVVGAQVNLSAYSATVYPTAIRSTGLGWIIGVGRIGAILGALVGSGFVHAGLTLEMQYLLMAVPTLVAGAAVHYARATRFSSL